MTIQHKTIEASLAINKGGAGRDVNLAKLSLLTPKQAALYLNLSVSWLAKRRREGNGPLYSKLLGAVRYDEVTLRQWTKSQQCISTSGS